MNWSINNQPIKRRVPGLIADNLSTSSTIGFHKDFCQNKDLKIIQHFSECLPSVSRGCDTIDTPSHLWESAFLASIVIEKDSDRIGLLVGDLAWDIGDHLASYLPGEKYRLSVDGEATLFHENGHDRKILRISGKIRIIIGSDDVAILVKSSHDVIAAMRRILDESLGSMMYDVISQDCQERGWTSSSLTTSGSGLHGTPLDGIHSDDYGLCLWSERDLRKTIDKNKYHPFVSRHEVKVSAHIVFFAPKLGVRNNVSDFLDDVSDRVSAASEEVCRNTYTVAPCIGHHVGKRWVIGVSAIMAIDGFEDIKHAKIITHWHVIMALVVQSLMDVGKEYEMEVMAASGWSQQRFMMNNPDFLNKSDEHAEVC